LEGLPGQNARYILSGMSSIIQLRMREVVMGPDGNLWVVTDADNGRLIKISVE